MPENIHFGKNLVAEDVIKLHGLRHGYLGILIFILHYHPARNPELSGQRVQGKSLLFPFFLQLFAFDRCRKAGLAPFYEWKLIADAVYESAEIKRVNVKSGIHYILL